jgi:hypothetical protein
MDPGTIGLLVAEGSALAAIAAAYSLGREPTKTTTTTVPPTETAAPAPAPAPTPVETTAVPAPAPVESVAAPAPAPAPAPTEVETPPVEPSSGEDPETVPQDVPAEPEKSLDDIVNEAILKAEIDQYTPSRGTVFQRLNPLARMNAARINRASTIAARKQQAGRRRTFRNRRGGEASFEKRVSSKLYSLKDSDPRPQTAFKTLVTVKEDRVATLLLPVFNAFVWWRYKVRMFPIRYSPILVADADTLFDDALKVHQDIHPIFLNADRSFKAEYMKPTTGKNVFLEGTNPFPQAEQNPFSNPEQTPEQNPFTEPEQTAQQNPFSQPVVPEPVVTPEPTTVTEPVVAQSTTVTEPVVTPEPTPVAEPTPVTEPVVTQEPTPVSEPTRPVSPPNAPPYFESLEIPPELQVKLDAAREKFETLKAKIANEEKKPGSPFAKLDSKQKRSEAARRAAETRKKNKVIAARDAEIQKAALEFRRKDANQARDERARKRAGIVPTTVETTEPSMNEATVESILETTEASTNEIAESLKALEKERPASASQNWFMDIENELQMYFEYYNQVERDLADVPPAQSASIPVIPQPQPASVPVIPPTLPTIPTQQKEALQLKKLTPSKAVNYGPNKTKQRFPVRKGGTPKKHKQKKTRKLTFRRSRKQ